MPLTLSLNCVLKVSIASHPTAHDLCLNRWRITPFTLNDCPFSHFKRNQCTSALRRATLWSLYHSDLQMTTLLSPKACLCWCMCVAVCVCMLVGSTVWKENKEQEIVGSLKDSGFIWYSSLWLVNYLSRGPNSKKNNMSLFLLWLSSLESRNVKPNQLKAV